MSDKRLHIGCHLSVSAGYAAMGKQAESIGADTFAFFTRNPRGGSAKALDMNDVEKLEILMKENYFAPLVAHAPYTMNLCSAKESVQTFSVTMLKEDIARMDKIPNNYYNFHPGSHVGQGIDVGIKKISQVLNEALPQVENTIVLLETMAGKGSEVGSRFEELQQIIEQTNEPDKLGVCMDTCHIYDAGYDIVNHLDDVLAEFDRIVGLKRIKAVHLNDSKNVFDSHKDRHAPIGEGTLGLDTFKNIVNHEALRHLPFILETPHEDLQGYQQEIILLRNMVV